MVSHIDKASSTHSSGDRSEDCSCPVWSSSGNYPLHLYNVIRDGEHKNLANCAEGGAQRMYTHGCRTNLAYGCATPTVVMIDDTSSFRQGAPTSTNVNRVRGFTSHKTGCPQILPLKPSKAVQTATLSSQHSTYSIASARSYMRSCIFGRGSVTYATPEIIAFLVGFSVFSPRSPRCISKIPTPPFLKTSFRAGRYCCNVQRHRGTGASSAPSCRTNETPRTKQKLKLPWRRGWRPSTWL